MSWQPEQVTGPSAHQSSALPLGQTASRLSLTVTSINVIEQLVACSSAWLPVCGNKSLFLTGLKWCLDSVMLYFVCLTSLMYLFVVETTHCVMVTRGSDNRPLVISDAVWSTRPPGDSLIRWLFRYLCFSDADCTYTIVISSWPERSHRVIIEFSCVAYLYDYYIRSREQCEPRTGRPWETPATCKEIKVKGNSRVCIVKFIK